MCLLSGILGTMEDTFMYLTTAILLSGYVIGLGAVTVIDWHGWLGRTSTYWTEATIRTHKVTKPLIWLGLCLVILGALGHFSFTGLSTSAYVFIALVAILVVNGLYLTVTISPQLLARERTGRAAELLPMSLQYPIMISFIISWLGWWGSFLLIVYLLQQ